MSTVRRVSGVRRFVTVVSALAILIGASGCGDGSGGETASGGGDRSSQESQSHESQRLRAGWVNQQETDVEPVSGGILEFSERTPTMTLDPVGARRSGATGMTAMAAIYDVLIRYNQVTGEYSPQLAKSLTPNDDYSVWTLTLRPDVQFTDGTPLNAEAVVFSVKRAGESKSSSNGSLITGLIDSYETPDPLTVDFHLTQPWRKFPFLLATGSGMVVSPTAVRAKGEEFETSPVGAGPFKVKSFMPGEKLELVRNEDYWSGEVHLDGVTFTSVTGAPATLDRLSTGGVDMIFMQSSQEPAKARDEGLPGFVGLVNGQGFLLNAGNSDSPASDIRVRQAIAAALNLEQLNQRVAKGTGIYGPDLFGEASIWHTDSHGPTHDPEKARELVAEAKADTGWDGSIRYLDTSANPPDQALALQAQLNSVGFDVTIEKVPSINALIKRVIVDTNFDITFWGVSTWDAAPWPELYDKYTGEGNYAGFHNAEMDQLIVDLGKATSDEEAKELLAQIQEIWTETVPFVVTHADPRTIFWSQDVHGVVPTTEGSVLLDDVFITSR